MRFLPLLLVAVIIGSSTASHDYNRAWGFIQKAIKDNNVPSERNDPKVWAMTPAFRKVKEFAKFYVSRQSSATVFEDEECKTCKEGVDTVLPLLASFPWGLLRPILGSLCEEITAELKLDGKILCSGFIDLQVKEIHRVLTWKGKTWTSDFICTTLNACVKKPAGEALSESAAQAERHHGNTMDTRSATSDNETVEIMKIVQFGDLHTNLEYAEGSATSCKLPICCRYRWKGTGSAKKWGEFQCNIPQVTLNAMLDEVNTKINPDFILYTGDSPPHTQWDETFESQRNSCAIVADHFKKHIPGKAVYPNLGNHDTFPTNLYYQPENRTKQMNIQYAAVWSQLIPGITNEQIGTMEEAGYYTILVQRGLRILSFNTLFGYVANWYVMLNSDVKAYNDQKVFMRKTLADARTNKEKVIMLGHIPPGGADGLVEFGSFYEEIVQEYSDVIVLMVSGHVHTDEFKVFMDKDRKSARNVLFVNPSATPFMAEREEGGGNPSVRVYHINKKTFELVNYEQYFLNLTKANENPTETPKLELLYTAKEEYNLTDLSPASYHSLVQRFEQDDATFEKYYKNMYVGRQTSKCDYTCRGENTCATKHTSLYHYLQCIKPFAPTEAPTTAPRTTPKAAVTTLKPTAAAGTIQVTLMTSILAVASLSALL